MFDRLQTFPCPSCKQIISDRAAACRFCGVAIDKGIAQSLAARQGRVNQACSDASYMKVVAVTLWGALAVGAGFSSVLLNSGFLVMAVLLPVLAVRWQWKFGRVETRDPDFAKARRAKNLSLALWLAALFAAFVVLPLLPADAERFFLTR